jgi:hypothetical protein
MEEKGWPGEGTDHTQQRGHLSPLGVGYGYSIFIFYFLILNKKVNLHA